MSWVAARSANVEFALVSVASDAWSILTAIWICRVVVGHTATLQLIFAALLFASLLLWQTDGVRLTTSVFDDLAPLCRRVTGCFAVCVAASIVLSRGNQHLVLATAALSAVTLPVTRIAFNSIARNALSIGRPKAIVVGAGKISRQIVQVVEKCDDYSFDIVGIVDDDVPGSEAAGPQRPILGPAKALSHIVRSKRISVVIVAFPVADAEDLIGIIRRAQAQGASVWVVPRFFELGLPGVSEERVWGLPLLKVAPPPYRRPAWLAKRLLDFALSSIGLIVLAPVMGAMAIAIMIESGSPILYRQTRVSTNGREFKMLKLRTMARAPDAVESSEWAADPERVTRLGRFLRRTGLDEVPQLINVVRGEMSLVGPRPERPYFVRQFGRRYHGYDRRHRIPAGITGWAQVNGLRGSDTSITDRLAFDNYYIENWSLAEDLKIMARTVKALRSPDGAKSSQERRSREGPDM